MKKNAAQAAGWAALACLWMAHAAPALAGPDEYVHPAVVEEGEREIDFKAGTRKLKDGTRESAYALGLGLGVNRWWFTEFYGKWHKEPDERHGFDAWEWENRFQLTETGKYPVDVGVLLEIERPKDRAEGWEYRWGPLFQMELGTSYVANLNFLVEKHIRAEEGGPAEFGYEWQLRYRWHPKFEFGVQGFGDFGPLRDFLPASEQSHRAGPMMYGALRVGERQLIKYNAGVLFGLTHGSPKNQLRMQVEYEF